LKIIYMPFYGHDMPCIAHAARVKHHWSKMNS